MKAIVQTAAAIAAMVVTATVGMAAATAAPTCKWATSTTPRVCVTVGANGLVGVPPGDNEMPGRYLTIDVSGPFFGSSANRLISITASGPGCVALDGMTWPRKFSRTHYRAEAAFLTGAPFRGTKTIVARLKSGSRTFAITVKVTF